MDHRDHVRLLREAVPAGGHWADLGSGQGAFTLALADLLGPGAEILSVDLDPGSLQRQRQAMDKQFPGTAVEYRVADFTRALELAGLDGIVMANSLHYIAGKEPVVRRLLDSLREGGRFVLVEYDSDKGNTWVPYPLSFRTWAGLATRCGLVETKLLHTIPSRFLGRVFSALSFKAEL